MKIVLVHYHLRHGGVTQVMLNQARGLLEAGDEVLVLTGEVPADPEAWAGIPAALVPELHYDRYRPAASGKVLARAMEKAVNAWGTAEILHIHNPLIRKNSSLLEALKILAAAGRSLFLQNHDLAEDFRPDVYSGEEYPENCHYAVINSRDYGFLLEAGLNRMGLHLIPNEVSALDKVRGNEGDLYLYPVRAIRRKNIGEALLLSLFLPKGTKLAITQSAVGHDAGPYQRWKELAAQMKLPVEFEAGRRQSFKELLNRSRCVITTSVKEGFGFAFLEPWTAGLSVLGRRIDYVCGDFEQSGVVFNGLYSCLSVPAEYAPPSLYAERLKAVLDRMYASFNFPVPPGLHEACAGTGSTPEEARLDFGLLDEEMQETALRAFTGNGARRELAAANPFLEKLAAGDLPGTGPLALDLIEKNRRAVLAAYSRERIITLLRTAYRAAAGSVTQRISRPRLLACCLGISGGLHFPLTGIAHE